MKAICHSIRFLGLLMGLFLLASGIANTLGFVPYSHETPAWSVRLVSSAPSMLVGLVLLLPNRHFLSERKFNAAVLAIRRFQSAQLPRKPPAAVQ